MRGRLVATGSGLARSAVLVIAGAVGFLCAPAAAQATCGDYLTIHPPAAADHPTPAAPAPCSGPHCSGAPTRAPLPAPAPVPTTVRHQEAWVADAVTAPGGPGERRRVRSTSPRPVAHPFRLERPPRA